MQPKSDTPPPPWREVTPLPGGEDERTCLIFISLACPFCAQYHSALWNWANSMPAGWRADFLPVLVQGMDSFIQLKAVRAATLADPQRLGDFLRSAYYAIQQQAMPTNSEDTWLSIVSASGYDMQAYSTAWQSLSDDRALIDPIVQKQTQYGVEATPSVVVAGKYVVTPDSTNGNEALFTQLLNAMVSKAEGVA